LLFLRNDNGLVHAEHLAAGLAQQVLDAHVIVAARVDQRRESHPVGSIHVRPVHDETLHDVCVALTGGKVQRCPLVVVARVGRDSVFEHVHELIFPPKRGVRAQEHTHFVPAEGGSRRRRHNAKNLPAGLAQQLLDFEVPVSTRVDQRRKSHPVGSIHVCASLDETVHDVYVALAGGEMQRCSLVVVARVDIHPTLEQVLQLFPQPHRSVGTHQHRHLVTSIHRCCF